MRSLFWIQAGLGLTKIWFAFTEVGRRRMAWHLVSGIAILILGVMLATDRRI